MKKITIAETVLEKTPKEFLHLPADAFYKLTKVENTRPDSFVLAGNFIKGTLSIVDVAELGRPGVKVASEYVYDYIRTSPIVEVTDATEDTITFRTEGGVYQLEKLKDN